MVRSVLLSCLAALGAAAQIVVPATPAASAGWQGYGEPCTFTATSSAQDVVTGVLTAGPYAVTDDAGVPAATVVIFCVLQENSDVPETNVVRTIYGPPMPGAGYLPPRQESIGIRPEAASYMCTGLWIRMPDGTYIHTFDDADVMRAGTQCPLAIKVNVP